MIYMPSHSANLITRLAAIRNRPVVCREVGSEIQYVLMNTGDHVTSRISDQGVWWYTRGDIPECTPGLYVVTYWSGYNEALLDLIPVEDDLGEETAEYATVTAALELADDASVIRVLEWGYAFDDERFPTSAEMLEHMAHAMF